MRSRTGKRSSMQACHPRAPASAAAPRSHCSAVSPLGSPSCKWRRCSRAGTMRRPPSSKSSGDRPSVWPTRLCATIGCGVLATSPRPPLPLATLKLSALSSRPPPTPQSASALSMPSRSPPSVVPARAALSPPNPRARASTGQLRPRGLPPSCYHRLACTRRGSALTVRRAPLPARSTWDRRSRAWESCRALLAPPSSPPRPYP
mmetsp:Transcript_59/g.110  ORF Transcript_59/g.110 Transcript_59/m.110 type:complete len:204 (+) Transcript_59:328-939(+)